MSGFVATKLRSFLVRSLAVVAVVAAYAFGTIGTQVLSMAGISAVALTTTAQPAQAQYWRRRRWYRRRWRRRW